MPNRGELPIPALRRHGATAKGDTSTPNADAWMVIGFCAIGWLLTFYFTLSHAGTDALSGMLTQIPLG